MQVNNADAQPCACRDEILDVRKVVNGPGYPAIDPCICRPTGRARRHQRWEVQVGLGECIEIPLTAAKLAPECERLAGQNPTGGWLKGVPASLLGRLGSAFSPARKPVGRFFRFGLSQPGRM